MKSIVFVIGCLELGGAENQLALLASQLAKRGWLVRVFVLDKRGPLVHFLDDHNISIIDGKYSGQKSIKFFKLITLVFAQFRLFSLLLVCRPDVVHGFLPSANFMAVIAGQLALLKCVVTSKRGLGTHQDNNMLWSIIDRISNRFSDNVTANSQAVALDAEQRDNLPAHEIEVIPNGLMFDRFEKYPKPNVKERKILNLNNDDIAIVKIANLIPYKGHQDLIIAFAKIADVFPTAKLFFAGADDTGIQSELLKQASALEIADRIHFMGQVSDIPKLLSAMDIGVLASHEEGLPNALIEKLAAGLPVVSTNVGGCPDIVEDMADCHLVPPKSPDELGFALSLACKNVPQNQERASSRIEIIKSRYSVEAMVNAYDRLYQTSLNNVNFTD